MPVVDRLDERFGMIRVCWVADRGMIIKGTIEKLEGQGDEADMKAVVESLEEELKKGTRQLVGNRGYRRFLRAEKDAVNIDRNKVEENARYDGKFMVRTKTMLTAEEVAVQ